jgi:hypothetical protein
MVQITSDMHDLLVNSELQAANQQFLSHVNANAYQPADRPSLCVIQGETAAAEGVTATCMGRGLTACLLPAGECAVIVASSLPVHCLPAACRGVCSHNGQLTACPLPACLPVHCLQESVQS